MARQFQPPSQIRQAPTKEEALLNPIAQTLQTLPSQWAQYKRQRLMEDLELKKARSLYGAGGDPVAGETPEQELARVGLEAYARLHPTQYFAPGVGPDGKPTFTPFPAGGKPGPALPAPTTVLDAEGNPVTTTQGKPTVLPKPSGISGKKEVQQVLDLYETAREGLISGLAGASSGPIAGRLPAVTAKQQTAEGGISAMAPVLKQLFRVAGEGTFTDKDQELLLNMVPTRKDHPEAQKAKIANIDNIVKAKLGLGKPEAAGGPQPGDEEDGYRFIGGNPADPASWEPL